MICFFCFVLFFFFCLKDFVFFCDLILLNSSVFFMVSISFPVLYLVFSFLFRNFNFFDNFFYLFLYVFIFFLLNFRFFISSSFIFLVLLEITVMPMSILVVYFSKDKDKIYSVFFMIFINIFGSIPFIIFLSISMFNFFLVKFSLVFFDVFFFKSYVLIFCYSLILIRKLPIFFLHFWLTKAHVSASGSCSMVLASLMLKLGSFGLFKFSSFFLFIKNFILDFVISIVLLRSLLVALIIIRSFDLKYVIACSSIVHIGLIYPLVLNYDSFSICASLFIMTGHGLVSCFLFFLITIVYELTLSRNFDFNKSLESSMKIISLLIFVFIFLNLGFPPFLNFIREFFFCFSLYNYSVISIFLFCILIIISIFFVIIFLRKILFGKKSFFVFSDNSFNLFFFFKSFIFFLFFLPFLY